MTPQSTPEKTKKHLPLWQETLLLLTHRDRAGRGDQGVLRAGVLHPVGVDGAAVWSRTTGSWSRRCPTGSAVRPQRGDVVVFKDPGGWLSEEEDAGPSNPLGQLMAKIGLYPSGGHLVKRVIGVAGDTIDCCDKQGRILVNGHPLDEEATSSRRRAWPATAR